MQYTVTIDPEEILGVPAGSSLEQVRAAYHRKAKKYHPDAQGDPWAFRLITRAYEILGRARVVDRIAQENARSAPAPPAAAHQVAPLRTPKSSGEHVRPGVRDQVDDPALLVDVEIFLIRFEMHDPSEFFLTTPEDRNLSCTLNLIWPSRRTGAPYAGPADPAPYLKRLEAALRPLARETSATADRTSTQGGQLSAWLTYPTARSTSAAFNVVHLALRNAGFGVAQSTRELLLPREDD